MFSGLSIRITVAALAVTGLLAVAPVASAAPDASAAATSADVVVKMPSAVGDRLGADREKLVDAVSADVLARSHDAEGLVPEAAVSKLADEGRKVVVDVRTVAGDWARGVAYVEASRAQHGEPEGWLYIAQRQNGRWIPGLEGDREFAAYVARSPLVGEAERRNMTAYAERRTEPQAGAGEVGVLANTNGLLLPWMPDYYMTLTGGPHAHDGGSGYWSALDFAGGNASGLVRSSREGTATSMCGAGAAGPGSSTRAASPRTTTTCGTPPTTTGRRSPGARCSAPSAPTPVPVAPRPARMCTGACARTTPTTTGSTPG